MTEALIEKLRRTANIADEASRDLANGAVCTGGEIEKFDDLIDAVEEAIQALSALKDQS